MFFHKNTLNLATNASPFDRNMALAYTRDAEVLADTLAVIHESYVNVVPITSSSRRSKYVPIFKGEDRAKGLIKQVKWVELEHKLMFIVASTNGLQIYDAEVVDLVYHHGCRDTGDENSYAIGICTLKSNILCIGTHVGTVWMFESNENCSEFKVINRVYAHDESVLLLEGMGSFMVSSSNMVTYLWSYNDKDFDIIRKLDVAGMYTETPNMIKFKFGLVIVAYTSGEFCIFDMNDDNFCIRTLAHKLRITGMDFSAGFLIATCSIDSYIKIWKYEQVDQKVNLTQTILNEDGPLYGVGFLNYTSSEFCAITGDNTQVKVYIDWESEVDVKDDE